MHCFSHLLAIAHGPHTDYHGIIDKMEPDENVTRLNKDLMAIDDVMQQTLQHRKFRLASVDVVVICISCTYYISHVLNNSLISRVKGAPGVSLPHMQIQYLHTPNLPHANPKP